MYAAFSKFTIGAAAIAVVAVGGGQIWARTAPTPGDIGLLAGHLRACESSTNCVNSESADDTIVVAPLTCGLLGGESLLAAVRGALASMPRTTVANEAGTWVHAVSTSAFFGFKDDVELRLSDDGRVVHIRSESRLGNGDLGVNRTRVQELQTSLDQTC